MNRRFIIFLLTVLVAALPVSSQTASSGAQSVNPTPSNTSQVMPDLSSLVIFVSCAGNKEMCVLALNANGTLESVPIETMKTRAVGSQRAITVGDVLIALSDLTREKAAVESDYNLLVGRYNRLAAINNTPSASNYSPTPTSDPAAEARRERQQLLMNWMTMQRSQRPQTFNVNVTDCTKFPALCVH